MQQVFGGSASQDGLNLTIRKSDLNDVGLTVLPENGAEQLFAGIVLRAAVALTEEARAADPASRNIAVFYSGQDLITQGTQTFRRDAYSVLLYAPTSLVPVAADNY